MLPEHIEMRVARGLLLGPVLGACLGITQKVVAAGVWVAYDCPDFYFRGWNAVRDSLAMSAVLGSIAGLPYGLIVVTLEVICRRRTRIGLGLFLSIVVTALATWPLVEFEFYRGRLLPILVHEGTSVLLASGLLLALSRRVAPS